MSKEKLLLVGAGGFGRMVAEQAMLQYNCAFVDDGQVVGTEICGIPVLAELMIAGTTKRVRLAGCRYR